MKIRDVGDLRDSDGTPTGPAVLLVGTRDEVRRAAAHMGEDVGVYRTASVEQARDQLAEARARLAVWSGEGVPEGWRAIADGEPYLTRRDGPWRVDVDPRGGWSGWRDDDPIGDGYIEIVHESDAGSVLAALAEAEAWLARVAVGLPPEPRRTAFTDLPGGGVCHCLNPDSPVVCSDCPEVQRVTDALATRGQP